MENTLHFYVTAKYATASLQLPLKYNFREPVFTFEKLKDLNYDGCQIVWLCIGDLMHILEGCAPLNLHDSPCCVM